MMHREAVVIAAMTRHQRLEHLAPSDQDQLEVLMLGEHGHGRRHRHGWSVIAAHGVQRDSDGLVHLNGSWWASPVMVRPRPDERGRMKLQSSRLVLRIFLPR